MFPPHLYKQRRDALCKAVGSGLLLIMGHEAVPVTSPDNVYPFRQDSSFLYYFGHNLPGFAGVIDASSGKHLLFGPLPHPEEFIWSGPQPSLRELAHEVGADEGRNITTLAEYLKDFGKQGGYIHYLPPYRADTQIALANLLDCHVPAVGMGASEVLIQAVIAQRSIKSAEEIAEVEAALEVSSAMYAHAFEHARPGRTEQDIKAGVEAQILARGSRRSFATIVTTQGHILHNRRANRVLENGDLLLLDSGAESPNGYASDITRTFPVSGHFSSLQRDMYALVLAAQQNALRLLAPGVLYRDAHLEAARTIVAGLKDMGIMQGDVEDAVHQGAHALLFMHGLGHMLGLDVHDMECLGEDRVGYDATITRSSRFGLRSLRLARKVQAGFVLTVEPGLYLVPALVEKWRSEGRCADFIRYDKLDKLKGFTGIRIEDDVLVEEKGARVLGTPIPREIREIEQVLG